MLGPAFPVTQGPLLNIAVVPAPVAGVDARAPTGNMPPENCLYTYNMMPAEYGMVLRDGYRRWTQIPDEGGQLGVYSMLPFQGVLEGHEDDRLFAVTNEGIWDATTYNTPVKKLGFTDQTEGAGHGVYAHYIDQAGAEFLLFADLKNGLFEYEASTDSWGPATNITGPTIDEITFAVVHKQRLWVVERDKSSAWYLPVASKDGAAEEFYFGSKFPHGGRLIGLFNWTVDGGLGVDDFLVAISHSGDVVVYQGEDPSSATTWSVRGTYFVGELPEGRRVASEYSGDLYILSTFGLISMKDLIRGVDQQNPSETSLAFRVARPLRDSMRDGRLQEFGWEPTFLPSVGNLVVMTPFGDGRDPIQYVMNLSTEGWGFWRDVPALSIAEWERDVYLGDFDGNVWIMDSDYDGGTNESGSNGSPIEFSLVSSTSDLGSPALYKQVQMTRPDFYANRLPDYSIDILYDYDYAEIPHSNASLGGSTDPTGYNKLSGTHGVGRKVTVAMRGRNAGETRLLSWDIMWKVGGPI